jgi:tRNA(Ser,Leu) C12 N-acetylase TAN1
MESFLERQTTEGAGAETASLAWNVLVTSREGGHRRLRRALYRLVRLHRTGFRNVLVGQVAEIEPFLAVVAGLCRQRPIVESWLGKIVPMERTFVVDAEHFDTQLQAETATVLDRLSGRSFHVRIERRGHKGVISTHAAEQRLGEHLYTLLQNRGQRPVVAFRDADVVLAIEIIGNVAGLGLVTRELRQRWPFVKID